MLCLSSQRIDTDFERAWAPVVGPIEHHIARFVSRGFLSEAPLEEKFDEKFRISDLKQMLDTRDIKIKGKKGEMIAALIDAMPAEEAATLVADVRIYRPTPEGQRRISGYVLQKEKAWKEMEAGALEILARGDVRKAWSRIAKYQSSQVQPEARWARGIPEPLLEEAAHLVRLEYDDLPLNEAQRRMAGAHLALSVLLGESFADAGKRMLRFTDGLFDWSQALMFLRPSPCGTEHEAGAAALAELYASTRIKEAHAACELDSLKSVRLGKGIKILPAHCLDCSICNGGKYQYEWSEIEALPRLPRQIGCQCSYAAWL